VWIYATDKKKRDLAVALRVDVLVEPMRIELTTS
jgi:hypothetical protein